MAVASSSTGRREEELLGPFIDTLGLAQPITIPADTLLGAITHFLSTLSDRDVTRLTVALVQSASLWNGEIAADTIRDAFSLAVESKVDILRARHRKSWFQSRRVSRETGRWLACITKAMSKDTSSDSVSTTHMRLGLLKGLQGVDLDLTKETMAMQESVVLSLAQIMETTILDRATLDMISEAVMCLDQERLSVLDPVVSLVMYSAIWALIFQTMLPLIQNALFAALDNVHEPEQQVAAYSGAIARLFEIIAKDEKLPDSVLASMTDFVAAFLNRAERMEANQRGRAGKGRQTGDYLSIATLNFERR